MTRFLLDTSILVPLAQRRLEALPADMLAALRAPSAATYASVASLWEVAIKYRLGKLPLAGPLEELLETMARMGIDVLDVTPAHALAEAQPVPATRDPFDRLLLAICSVENLRLLTTDRALAAHPLAWRAED